jgi:hypothetical protein
MTTDIRKKALTLCFTILSFLLLFANSASAQVDYYYGRNLKGLRILGGIGFNVLENKFQVNPVNLSYTTGLEYNTSRFLSFGLEYQGGTLIAQNKPTGPPHQPFSKISNTYQTGNFNVKASFGLIDDFDTDSQLAEILKDLYLGAGVGVIKSNVKYTPAYATPDYIVVKPNETALVFPFNVGVNIDLPRIKGKDLLQLNSNFQFNVVNGKYLEGFSSYFTKIPVSLYNVFSVGVRVKL